MILRQGSVCTTLTGEPAEPFYLGLGFRVQGLGVIIGSLMEPQGNLRAH